LYPHHHPLIGKAKDVAAAAVLISSIAAALVGGLIFFPALVERYLI
jgi:diacylglycerol kinase